MFLWFWIIIGVLFIWSWKTTRRPAWAPPGPPLMPWIGNIASFRNSMVDVIECWLKKYGTILYFQLGYAKYVILADGYDIIDYFSKTALPSRPRFPSVNRLTNGGGIFFGRDGLWQESRRIITASLRNFNPGNSPWFEPFEKNVETFICETLEPNIGRPIDISGAIGLTMFRNAWYTLNPSKDSSANDIALFDKITKLQNNQITCINQTAWLDYFPYLLNIFSDQLIHKLAKLDQFKMDKEDWMRPMIEAHKSGMEAPCGNFVDSLLLEQRRKPAMYTDEHIFTCINEYFVAAVDTTSATLNWAFCFLANHPEEQRRLQQEIDAVVGTDRLISLLDRPNMPYTRAFIAETQRRADIAPFGVQQAATVSTEIRGYTIPAGTIVQAYLRGVHYNEKLFPQAMQFKPERFLSDDGQFVPSKYLMPFSKGKRQCPGQASANGALFLMLTKVLQKYSVEWPCGFSHDLTSASLIGFITHPKPYTIIIKRR